MKKWITSKLKDWLGLQHLEKLVEHQRNRISDLESTLFSYVEGSVDVHIPGRANTTIVVISRLKGGYVQIYDFNAKDFNDLQSRCLSIMGPAWPNAVIDAPPDIRRHLREHARNTW